MSLWIILVMLLLLSIVFNNCVTALITLVMLAAEKRETDYKGYSKCLLCKNFNRDISSKYLKCAMNPMLIDVENCAYYEPMDDVVK